MNPVLLPVGPLAIHSYPALVNLGLVLGAALVVLQARRRALALRSVADVMLGAAFGGLVLARAAYVSVHCEYYVHHVHHALRLWQGGLLWQGALLGGLIGSAAVCSVRGMPLARSLDLLAPGTATLAAFAWLGCFSAGCAWGVEAYPGQGLLWTLSLDLPDLYGIREPRVAVQLIGAVWSVLVLTVILAVKHSPEGDGLVFALWLMLQSFGAFALDCLRADKIPTLNGWRIDQLANLTLTVAGVVLLCLRLIRDCRNTMP